jgi:hypothetical protein
MKKITALFFAILLAGSFASAAHWWARSFVTVTSNQSLYNYAIVTNVAWTVDNNWTTNTPFDSYDFGEVNSLILNGGYGQGGYNGSDYLDESSFVLYYRVYSTTGTPGSWSSIPITNFFFTQGSVNVIYNNISAGVDVLALVDNAVGSYYLEVILTKTNYWNAQKSSSFTTANGGTVSFALNTSSEGYKAMFNISRINVSSNVNLSTLAPTAATDVTVLAGNELTITDDASVKSITVDPGAKLTLTSGALTLTNGITLQNSALGTASFVDERTDENPLAIAGTVEQPINETNRNWYVSIPVSGKIAADIAFSGARIVQRNEAQSRWDDVLSESGLTPGVGYIAIASAGSGATTWTLNGNLNSGKVEVPVTRSGVSSAGYNLLGNPYPSYLNWEQVLNLDAANETLLQSSIWYRTKSDDGYAFQTYNAAGRVATPATTSGFIPPLQAFWVRTISDGTVTFNNAMRSHGDGTSNKLKAPGVNTQKIVRLQVSNADATDEAVVYFDQNAHNSFDKYDTEKMFNNVASQPELYSKANSEKLVINGLSEVNDNLEIPLGITYKQGGNLKFKLTELSNFDSNTKVYLCDKDNNIEIELTPETEYIFNTAANTINESRFSLLFKAPGATTLIDNPEKEQISVFLNLQKEIVIMAQENFNYAIYNAMGQLIESGVLKMKNVTLNTKLTSGLYIVRLTDKRANHSTYIILK